MQLKAGALSFHDDDEVMLNVLRCQLTYLGHVVTNAEAWFSIALRPRKPEGSLGRTAQDGHLTLTQLLEYDHLLMDLFTLLSNSPAKSPPNPTKNIPCQPKTSLTTGAMRPGMMEPTI